MLGFLPPAPFPHCACEDPGSENQSLSGLTQVLEHVRGGELEARVALHLSIFSVASEVSSLCPFSPFVSPSVLPPQHIPFQSDGI